MDKNKKEVLRGGIILLMVGLFQRIKKVDNKKRVNKNGIWIRQMLLKIGSKVVNPMCLHKPSSDQFPSLTIQGIFGIPYREKGVGNWSGRREA